MNYDKYLVYGKGFRDTYTSRTDADKQIDSMLGNGQFCCLMVKRANELTWHEVSKFYPNY